MKSDSCKIPLKEDQCYVQKKMTKCEHFQRYAIFSMFIIIASLTTVAFTICTLNRIKKLELEVQFLRTSIKSFKDLVEKNGAFTIYPQKSENKEDVDNLHTNIKNFTDDYDFNYDYLYDEKPEDNSDYDRNEIPNAPIIEDINRKKRSINEYGDLNSDSDQNNDSQKFEQKMSTSSQYQSQSSRPNMYQNIENWRTTPIPIYNRKSKNMLPNRKSNFARLGNEEENSEETVEFTVVRDRQFGRGGRVRHRQRNLENLDSHQRLGRMRPLPTVHFSGDTSKYIVGQHPNFNGNGHLRHPQRTFVDWAESSWVHSLGMDQHYEMNDGYLTIKESGLYFVYAQIYYLDEHDINGFRVHKNDETMLQCTIMIHSVEKVKKGNTCYTAGAEYLMEGDQISLRDLSDARYSIFEPGKSFFGIIKLGDVKTK